MRCLQGRVGQKGRDHMSCLADFFRVLTVPFKGIFNFLIKNDTPKSLIFYSFPLPYPAMLP